MRIGVTWACLKKFRTLSLLKRGINYRSDGGDENIQIFKTRKVGQGSREHDLFGEFIMILVT